MPSYPVKWFSSSMGGAPVLANEQFNVNTGFNNPLTNLFTALFTNGFNTRTDATAVINGGVATLTFPTAHGYFQWAVIHIAGASEALLNGEQRVLSVPTSTTLTVAVPGAANGTVTGTITTKVAPLLNWNLVGVSSSVATVSSAIVNGSLKRNYTVRFDPGNSPGGTLGISGAGARAFPGVSGQGVAMPWVAVVDPQSFYFFINTASSLQSGPLIMCGEFRPLAPTDIYNAAVFGAGASDAGVASLNSASAGTAVRFADGTGGTDVSLTHQMESFYNGTAGFSGATVNTLTPSYPNGNGNGLILSRRAISDSQGLRGWFRGMYQTPQVCHTSFSQFQVFDGQGYFAGRKMMALKCGQAVGTTSQGVVFFDIDGPWESWS
jgi:hypothetical protein